MDWATAMNSGSTGRTGFAVSSSAGCIAAITAASMKDAKGLAHLCKSGATLEEKDEEGNSVTHLVCEIGDEDLVEAVLDHFKDEPSKLDQPNEKVSLHMQHLLSSDLIFRSNHLLPSFVLGTNSNFCGRSWRGPAHCVPVNERPLRCNSTGQNRLHPAARGSSVRPRRSVQTLYCSWM
jgi:hypothetical protein